MTTNTAPTFTSGDGRVFVPIEDRAEARSIVLQPDGKVLVAGWSEVSTGNLFAITRLNADGTLDQNFANAGKALINVGATAYALALQPDGKILMAGWGSGQPSGVLGFQIIRLNADGTLDSSFADDGKASIDVSPSQDFSYAMTLQPDGKVLVAGYSIYGDSEGGDVFAITRLNADGSLDESFAGDGKVLIDVSPGYDRAYAMTLQPDGKVLVAGLGGSMSAYAIIRLNADGSLDESFGEDGKALIDEGYTAYALALQTDGKILVSGGASPGFLLVRLNTDGTLDESFAGDGKALIYSNIFDEAYALAQQPDGKILIAGGLGAGFTIARVNTDGSLDESFARDGEARIDMGGYNGGSNKAYSLALQSDGRILIAGGGGVFSVLRLNPDGSRDLTFFSSVANSLEETVNYREQNYQVLDSEVFVRDAELEALGDFSGASLTLVRKGGASAEDTFSAATSLFTPIVTPFLEGSFLAVGGVTMGRVQKNSDGVLELIFLDGATHVQVNAVLSNIEYHNTSDAPPAELTLTWIFNDGEQGAQGDGEALSVTAEQVLRIAAVNDAPQLVIPLPDLAIGLGQTAWLPLADGNFIDPDGDRLIYSLLMEDGTGLPPWLRFDASTGAISGQPGAQDAATLALRLEARDPSGARVSDYFSLTIKANQLPSGEVVISGDPVQGKLLSASNTLSDPDGLGEISYQWRANGVPIQGATERQLTLSQKEAGKNISVIANYIDGAGVRVSVESVAILVNNTNDLPTGSVFVTGTADEGQTLTASNDLDDPDGIGPITYRWLRNGDDIGGATEARYTLTLADVGKRISVVASYTDDFGTIESVGSAATAVVKFASITGGVMGGRGDDRLTGTEGDDVFQPQLGNDIIFAGGGIDTVQLPFFVTEFFLQEEAPGKVVGTYGEWALELNDVEFLEFGTEYQATVPIADVVSGAAQDKVKKLSDLYLAFFGRAPDAEGLEFWQEFILEKGLSLTEISQYFASSAEAQTLYPADVSNREFVRNVYVNAFDREPEAGGWDFWTGVLDQVDTSDPSARGTFVADVILGAYSASSGPRDQGFLSNRHEVSLGYVNRLQRQPDEGKDNAITELLMLVTNDDATVAAANDLLDYVFSDPITLTGVMSDPVLVDSFFG